MKWFQHQCDADENKKLRKIEKWGFTQGGEDGAMAATGRYWRLLEKLGKSEENTGKFEFEPGYDLELVADDLRCSPEYLTEFCNLLSQINAIDAHLWEEKREIVCPKLADRADEYYRKRAAKKQACQSETRQPPKTKPTISGQHPEKDPTISGHSPESNPIVSENTVNKHVHVHSQETPTIDNPLTEIRDTEIRDIDAQSHPKPPGGGNGDARPQIIFSCPHFEIDQEFFDALLQDFRGLNPEILHREIHKAADWITDNPSRYKRKAKTGYIANPRSFLRRWLEKVEVKKPLAVVGCSQPGIAAWLNKNQGGEIIGTG